MRTKISLALGERRPLSRETAWGCFTTNLALPGLGSLVAGRVSGYFQAALAFGGMAVTLVTTGGFVAWYFNNYARLRGPQADPVESLLEIWRAVRWPLAGFAIFGVGWLWAMASSWQILNAAKRREAAAPPPRLQ